MKKSILFYQKYFDKYLDLFCISKEYFLADFEIKKEFRDHISFTFSFKTDITHNCHYPILRITYISPFSNKIYFYAYEDDPSFKQFFKEFDLFVKDFIAHRTV